MSTPRKKKPALTGDGLLFRRTTKPTKSIVTLSDLWLDLFVMYSEGVLTEHGDWAPDDVMQRARLLADAAMSTYQERWPGVEPPQ